MAKSTRTIFQLAALAMLLIVFPAMSWYYLNSGLEYRRSALNELKEYGTFPKDAWVSVDGAPISSQFLDDKMLLAYVMDAEMEASVQEQYGLNLQRLHDQFDERNELIFVTLLKGDSASSFQQAEQFKQTFQLMDEDQQLFFQLDEQKLEQIEKGIQQANSDFAGINKAYFLLTDTKSTIRRYYDAQEEPEMKRLVEHIAMLLPTKKDRELIFQREVEK